MMRKSWLSLLVCLATAARAAGPTLETQPNGMRCIVMPTTSSQMVSAVLLVDFSALDEPAAYQGLRGVLVSSMLQGSTTTDGQTLRRSLAALGATLEGLVHQDMLEFTVTMPASALPAGMAALAEVVCRPQLSDAGIQATLQQAQEQARLETTGARDIAADLSRRLLYAGHPYETDGKGAPATLARITPSLVRAAYQAYLTPGAAVLAVVGRSSAAEARELAARDFQEWTARPRVPRPIIEAPTLRASRLEVRESPVNLACVMLTFPAYGAGHEDFLILRVIDVLLGGGTGSRLFRVVREERRLAYDVSSLFPSQASGSHVSIYALTSPLTIEKTRDALVAELARLQTEPVPEAELARAKGYLKGRYMISHQFSARHAFDLAWYELEGIGIDYDRTLAAGIDAVTADDVQRVAREVFTRYYLVVVLPEAGGPGGRPTASLGVFAGRVQHQCGRSEPDRSGRACIAWRFR